MRFDPRLAPLLIASLTFCAWAPTTGCSNGATGTPTPTSTSAATGATTGAGGAVATPDLPCDVDDVLKANCQSCHGATPTFGAPMPLVTLADLEAPAVTSAAKKVYELVGTRTHDDLHPMPQAPNPLLNAADQKVIDDWIAGGAKAGTTDCGSGGAGGAAPAAGQPRSLGLQHPALDAGDHGAQAW